MRGILFFAALAFGVGIVHGLPFAWTEVEGHEADIGEAAAGYRDFSVKATFWNSEETPVSSISSSVLHVGHGKQEGLLPLGGLRFARLLGAHVPLWGERQRGGSPQDDLRARAGAHARAHLRLRVGRGERA